MDVVRRDVILRCLGCGSGGGWFFGQRCAWREGARSEDLARHQGKKKAGSFGAAAASAGGQELRLVFGAPTVGERERGMKRRGEGGPSLSALGSAGGNTRGRGERRETRDESR